MQYWQKNITSFPETQLVSGLRRLADEVQQDLKIGPAETMKELKELQAIIINKEALKIDVTVDPALLQQVDTALAQFLQTIPSRTRSAEAEQIKPLLPTDRAPIMKTIESRAGISGMICPGMLPSKTRTVPLQEWHFPQISLITPR